MKYYITKYALTDRIVEAEGERDRYGDILCLMPGIAYRARFKEGRDAFTDKEDAIADAYARRDRKIESLNKQIEKLQAMEFGE